MTAQMITASLMYLEAFRFNIATVCTVDARGVLEYNVQALEIAG